MPEGHTSSKLGSPGAGLIMALLNRRFFRDEGGLVTVEWVAVAGAVAIAGITIVWIAMNNIQSDASDSGGDISACGAWAAAHHGSTAGCTHGHHGNGNSGHHGNGNSGNGRP